VVTSVQFEGDETISELKFFPTYLICNVFELETFVNSIETSDNVGKEIVLLIDTLLQNNKTFYTDSNGLEL